MTFPSIACNVLALALASVLSGAALAADVLLVGNKSAASVHALDLGSGEKIAEFPTRTGPHEIEVSPDRRFAVVSDYGDGKSAGNTITVIDWQARKVARTIDLGDAKRPHGMRFLPDGRRLVATTEGSGQLTEVDIVDGKVLRRIDVGEGKPHMVAISPDGRKAYVTQVGAGVLSIVDLDTGTKVADVATGKGAEGIAITRDGAEVWVSNREDDTVSIVDAASLKVVATLPTKGFPIRIAFSPDDRHALVTNAKAAVLEVFDRPARRSIARIALDEPGVTYQPSMLGDTALPIGARVDPDGKRAYAAVSGGDVVAVIDTATWKVVSRWRTGREPDALAIIREAGKR